MQQPKRAKNLDSIFEALAHQHRRAIIYSLGLQPYAISQLANQRNLSLPAIHKHIKILKEAKLVQEKKVGRTHFLTLNHTSLIVLQDWLMQFHTHWGSNKATFKNYGIFLQTKSKKNT